MSTVWGIIGAMDREIELLRQQADITERATIYGSEFCRATLEGQQVILVCSGVGKVNASLCAAALIRELGADYIVHIGVAGAAAPDLTTLDMVVSSDAVYHDVEPGVLLEYFPNCDVFKADDRLIALAQKACAGVEAAGRRVLLGRVATGDQFVSSSAVKQDIVRRTNAACIEMEGAAVAHTAFVNNVPFVILRTMSDTADGPTDLDYYHFKPLAADQSAGIVLKMLRMANL